jgi:hypothetical protein
VVHVVSPLFPPRHNPAVKADACRLRRQSPFTSALGSCNYG